MIVHSAAQGHPDWWAARQGKVTASRANAIVKPKKVQLAILNEDTGRMVKQKDPDGEPIMVYTPAEQDAYLYGLAAERVINQSANQGSGDGGSSWTDRGRELEWEAREWVSLVTGHDFQPVGFCERDDGSVGASPDGLAFVGTHTSGCELKCPGANKHVAAICEPDLFLQEHRGQVQCSMYVTGASEYWLCSYCPGLPSVLIRCEPDGDWLSVFVPALEKFNARLEGAVQAIEAHDPYAALGAKAAEVRDNPFL